ncbi:MAG: hypothetical protein IH845_02675 [Nanoarchaeota archaeon]|nr:hypothetical protein [Nanoarchaeota archaeon]
MLKSKKNVFWEALVITIAIFAIGLFLGITIETSNLSKISEFYTKSEIALVDGMAITTLSEEINISCDFLREENIKFANKIYEEAKLLEEYEAQGKITDNMILLHQKYDLLRTLLWLSNQDSLIRCENYDLIVYLYEYNTEDIQKQATQNVWSKILLDIRSTNENLLLIPIATDQNLTSLNLLMNKYGIDSYPAVIVNNRKVIYALENIDTINPYLGQFN